jgi:hypothetical protein
VALIKDDMLSSCLGWFGQVRKCFKTPLKRIGQMRDNLIVRGRGKFSKAPSENP